MIGSTTSSIQCTDSTIQLGTKANQLIFQIETGTPLPKGAWVYLYVDNSGQTGDFTADFSSLSIDHGCFFQATGIDRTACKQQVVSTAYMSFQAPDQDSDPEFLTSFTLTLTYVNCASQASLNNTLTYIKVKSCAQSDCSDANDPIDVAGTSATTISYVD